MGQRLGVLENDVSNEAWLYRELLKYVTDIEVDPSGQLFFYLSKDNVPDLKIPIEAVFVNATDIISIHRSFLDLLFEGENGEKKFIVRVTPNTDNTRYICMKNDKILVRRSNNPDEITWILKNFFTDKRYTKSQLESKAYGDLLSSTRNGKVIPLPASSGDPLSSFQLVNVGQSFTISMQLVAEGFKDHQYLAPLQPKLCLRRYPPLTNCFRSTSYRDKPKLQRDLEGCRRLFHKKSERKLKYREFTAGTYDARYDFDIYFQGIFTMKESS